MRLRTLDAFGELTATVVDAALLGVHRVVRRFATPRPLEDVPPEAELVVPRRESCQPREFVDTYLRRNRPVIITDAMRGWPAMSRWTPDFFAERFGHLDVPLQGSAFNAIARMSLRSYVDLIRERERTRDMPDAGEVEVPYLRFALGRATDHALLVLGFERWASRKVLDSFTLACFTTLQDDWAAPYFLPTRNFWRPFNVFDRFAPNHRYNPEFGILISPRGAVTRLHADYARTNALIFQIHGHKTGLLYRPEHHVHMDGLATAGVEPIRFSLAPGEVIFVPRGWLHEVRTESASVSLTYNFVHLSEVLRYVVEKVMMGAGTPIPKPVFDG